MFAFRLPVCLSIGLLKKLLMNLDVAKQSIIFWDNLLYRLESGSRNLFLLLPIAKLPCTCAVELTPAVTGLYYGGKNRQGKSKSGISA